MSARALGSRDTMIQTIGGFLCVTHAKKGKIVAEKFLCAPPPTLAAQEIDIKEAMVLYSFFSFFKKNDVFAGYV